MAHLRFEPLLTAPLELERLRLRALEESDAPALFGIHSNVEVARYLSRPAMTDIAQARELVERVRAGYESGSSVQLGIERKEDGALVGYCLLFNFHEVSRRAEIGYSLGRPYWGCGYMSEALAALVAIAFEKLDLNRLEADIDPRNAGSARSLERLGFAREGDLRERWIVNGEVSDTRLYGLLRREWHARG
jgi:ribosomal-protein-alanine N-acetyltransferase